ncbi:uncharacterized protein B0I36DRAFT_261385 [Microdochium trichocladiopsis]|uniref:FAD-binding domain-containing protein n=1 Tax=Microdochium trichocladiopsis TaxID=1682393 RepID=A0A9P8YJR3_9PEZI|nr:uncharacterized protein B0I36DRAFT_261385 [Microdochium trichocladiopsis]KAH7041555.1 hypothetical protein B0I36DRAFT_261385 [Microdochium trichocladiopsis]
MKIIIIGAGLGGLAAAVRLSMLAHEVVVVEKHPALSPRGGSLSTRPGASRILAAWGLQADMDEIANRTEGIFMRSLATGRVMTTSSSSSSSLRPPHWGTTREELIRLFYDKAVQHGASIRFGCSVTEVHDEAGQDAWIKLADGECLAASMILAADGIRSRTRAAVLADLVQPEAMQPLVSDITGYGFKLQASVLRESGDAAALVENVSSNVWMGGPDNVFAVSRYSPKSESVAVLCHTVDAARNSEQDSLWDDKGDLAYLRAAFRGASGAITGALEMAESCDRWRLAELPSLPRWTSSAGRIVLLGDSAHAMHPSAGQGFSQIVEDIEVLAELISRSSSIASSPPAGKLGTDAVAAVTRAWQGIRKPRVEKIQEYSRWSTAQVSRRVSRPGPADSQSAQVLQGGDEEFRDPTFIQWTLDYDVKEEVDLLLELA